MLLTAALLFSTLSLTSPSLLPAAAPEPESIALRLHFPMQNLVVPDPHAILSSLREQSLVEMDAIADALSQDAAMSE